MSVIHSIKTFSLTMVLDFYLSSRPLKTKGTKQKIDFTDSVSLYKFTRNYNNGNEVIFYTTTSLFGREMYIYIGDFIEKLVLSYIEVSEKCTKRSVKKAFELCPNLTKWISQYSKGKDSPIRCLTLYNNTDKKVYCLGLPYSIIFDGKKSTYNELSKIAETIREEGRLINKSALVGNGVFAAKAKKALATTAKYTIKAGAMILLGAIGANIDGPDINIDIPIPNVDLPDFDFEIPEIDVPEIDVPEIDIPDIDVPDIDITTDLGNDINIPETDLNYDTPDQGNEISFQGKDSLPPNANKDGFSPQGSIELERTISGSTDKFKLFTKDGKKFVLFNGNYIPISGSGTVNINNIKYDKIG